MALFRPDEERAVREFLAEMERPVELALVLGPESEPLPGAREIDFSAEAQRVVEELVELGDLLSARVHEQPAYGVHRFPAICVLPEGKDVGIRYYGLPWGYELTSVVGACAEAGRLEPRLTRASLDALAGLEHDLEVEVYVTPT